MSRPVPAPPTDERGFTLLEMIVALMLLGLVLGLVGGGAQLLRGTGDRLADRSATLGDLALLTTILQERLGDAVLLDFGPAGSTYASFDGTPERVRFTTVTPDVAAGAPLVAMELGAAEDDGIELVLTGLAAPERDFARFEEAGTLVPRRFLAGAAGARLSYFGRKARAARAEWHERWQEEPRLPRAVRLELAHDRLALPPLIVPIRQDLASLCASAVQPLPCPSP